MGCELPPRCRRGRRPAAPEGTLLERWAGVPDFRLRVTLSANTTNLAGEERLAGRAEAGAGALEWGLVGCSF
jgi:hypothetical protein